MESIKSLLLTPEWWFSAIFVSIVTGVIATYAKEWVSGGLSAISTRYKARAARLKQERRQRIALLLMEPALLVVAHQRVTQLLIMYVVLNFLALGFPTYAAFVAHFPEADPFRQFFTISAPPGIRYLPVVVTATSLVWALQLQAKLTDLTFECKQARKRVEEATAARVAEHAATRTSDRAPD